MEKYQRVFIIRSKKSPAYFRAVIELELEKEKGRDWVDLREKEFIVISLSGDLYFSSTGRGRPAWISSGQIDMTLRELDKNDWNIPYELEQLLKIWEEYHLNDLTAGTKKQMEALKEKDPELLKTSNYDKAVEYLKSIGLYEDRGYRYGEGWLIKPIPDEVMARLKAIFQEKYLR